MIQDSINQMLGAGEKAVKSKKIFASNTGKAGANSFAGEPQMKLNNLAAFSLAENNLQTNIEAKRRQQQMLTSNLVSFYGGKD